MARAKKGWTKANRRFLNSSRNATCMGAVSWSVQYTPPKKMKANEDSLVVLTGDKEAGEEYDRQAHVYADISINDDAQTHWVSRKADLRVIRNMRAELDKFEEACMEALTQAEEANAES